MGPTAGETVTFLMTDIEGSTLLWEGEPEVMRRGLRIHDEVLRRAVTSSGGSFVKHTGDGIMAAFGDPSAAVHAAIRAQSGLLASDVTFKVRVGISTGDAEHVGDDWFGAGPSRAARVMAVAHGDQIVISDSTAELVRAEVEGAFALLDLGIHELRGIAEPLRLWQVSAPELPAAFPPTMAHLDPSRIEMFVGRGAEVATLRHVLGRAFGGQPSVGLVVGEPGIGKSRLADELVAHARHQGARVLRGEAAENDATPFGMWVGVTRELARGLPVEVGAEGTPDPRWDTLDLVSYGLADVAPALLVLEDLHWADESSLWVLERLPRRLASARVAVIGTTRPDEPGAVSLGGVRRLSEIVELTGLDVDAVERLARSVGADPDLDAASLRDRTDGNPLFVRELLALRGRDGRLPDVVRDLLAHSLERVEPRCRRTLAALACAAGGTPLPVLASALDISNEEALTDLEYAAAADLVRLSSGSRATFRHALLADAAASELSASERRSLHSRLAEAWASQPPSRERRSRRIVHLVAALPRGDAESVALETITAVRGLREAGEVASAAELARVGVAALGADTLIAAELRARLGIELGHALEAVGDQVRAMEAFDSASAPAADAAVPELEAEAAVGAVRHANPFMPQFDRLHTLARIEAALPPEDSPLRVDVLGRMCVLGIATPDGVGDAHGHGDEAVAMARRLDNPGLLARALADRHLVPAGYEGYEAKAEAADELVALGERLRDVEVLLHGYEWQIGAGVDRFDLAVAEAALERFEALAQLMSSPRWRYTAMVRRYMIEALRGRRVEALALITEAAALGATFQDDLETVSIELGARQQIHRLWGVPDERLPHLFEQVAERWRAIPAPFVRIQVASGALSLLGDREAARSCVDRFAPSASVLPATMEGPIVLNLLAAMVAHLGMAEHAPVIREVLLPFQHRLCSGNSVDVGLPAATSLGRLALMENDIVNALSHHELAVGLVRGMRSPPLLARCLAYLAEARRAAGDTTAATDALREAHDVARTIGVLLSDDLGPAVSSSTSRDRTAELVRSGDQWTIRCPMGSATIGHSIGVAQLARLLAGPGREIAATDLAGMDGNAVPVAADLGPALDARAKREYRQRVAELHADIDDADADNDLERAARARLELDALISELRHAVGLTGRDRPTGSGAERARVNVTRTIRRATAIISDVVPDLGAHLTNAVRTGRYCVYTPEPAAALAWNVKP